jgi:hypothetical protein
MTIDNFSAMRILLNYQSLLNFIIILKNPSSLLIISFKTKRFQDLKSDLNYLRENVISKTANSSDNLLKTNISSFMDAINIMKGDFLTKKKLLKHFF